MMSIDRLMFALMLGVLIIFMVAGAAISQEAPWAAADRIEQATAKIERLMYRQPGAKRDEQISAQVKQAEETYRTVLQGPIRRASPDIALRIDAAFDGLKTAAASSSREDAARARNAIWTGLLHGAYIITINGLENDDLEKARIWLSLREYALASRDTAAAEAMDGVLAGKLDPSRALEIVQSELLRVYAGELRRALAKAVKAAAKGYSTQFAGAVARGQGLFTLLSSNVLDRLGAQKHAQINEKLSMLAANINDAGTVVGQIEDVMLGYSPVALSTDERERRARLLARFLKLVYIEYKDGVRNGRITIHVEYEEARLFRNRAAMLLGDLQGEMLRAAPQDFSTLRTHLKEMQQIIEVKGKVSRIKELSAQSAEIITRVFAIEEETGGHKVAFQILPSILDEIVMLVRAGDYPGAEFKRLEAYSFFDPDIEQRLVPRAPTLSLKLESRFWEGSASNHGLGKLLKDKASADVLERAVKETRVLLIEAKGILNTKLGSTGAFLQALAIILREGLEAIIVIAALIGALNAAGVAGYKPYLWGGVLVALAMSFGTWYAAGHFLTISTTNRELMEGLTALLAAVVLIYVTHWIFHKAYVIDWLSYVKGKVRETAGPGRLLAITSLGFFVVYREGFETVLFYEALMIDASPAPVLGGFAVGVLGTIAIAVALLYMGLKLPLNIFFKATGFLLLFLSVIFTGVGIRGLQTADLISATPVPGFPEWPFLQLYVGIFPVAEPLIAQALVLALFAVGLGWLRLQARKPLSTSHAA